MRRTDLVAAKTHDQQRMSAADASAHVAQKVERRLVRPVQIFEHDQCRRPGQCGEKTAEDTQTLDIAIERGLQLTFDLFGDVEQGTERPRRLQSIAGAPIHRHMRRAADSAKARNSDVLPMPASPSRNNKAPWPAAALRSSTCSEVSSSSRSNSFMPGPATPTPSIP